MSNYIFIKGSVDILSLGGFSRLSAAGGFQPRPFMAWFANANQGKGRFNVLLANWLKPPIGKPVETG